MTSEEIRAALFKIRSKKTMTDIANDLSVSKQMVSAVVARKYKSRRVQKAIAEAIGHDPVYVWPELLPNKTNKTDAHFI